MKLFVALFVTLAFGNVAHACAVGSFSHSTTCNPTGGGIVCATTTFQCISVPPSNPYSTVWSTAWNFYDRVSYFIPDNSDSEQPVI